MVARMELNGQIVPKWAATDEEKLFNEEYEQYLQATAGIDINTNYDYVRTQLALQENNENNDLLYRSTQRAIEDGETPEQAADFVSNHLNEPITKETSLERASTENQSTISYSETPYSFINDAIDNIFIDDALDEKTRKRIDDGAIAKLASQPLAVDNDYLYQGATFITGALAGPTSDVISLKSIVPDLNIDEIRTIDDFSNALNDKLNEVYKEQGLEGYKKYMNTLVSNATADAVPFYTRYMLTDIIANGTDRTDSILGSLGYAGDLGTFALRIKPSRLTLRDGNKNGAATIAATSEDVAEKVDTWAAKMVDIAEDTPKDTRSMSQTNEVLEAIYNSSRDKDYRKLMTTFLSNPNTTDELTKAISTKYKLPVADVSVLDVSTDRGFANVVIGGGFDGTSALTKKGAENLRKKLRLSKKADIVKQGDGYVLKVDNLNIKDFGALLYDDLSTKEFGKFKGFGRQFFARANLPQWFHDDAITGFRQSSAAKEMLSNMLLDNYNSLSRKERNTLENVINKGVDDSVWYDDDTLIAMGLNNKQIEAYHDYKKLNDFRYTYDNNYQWKKEHSLGFRTTIDGQTVRPLKASDFNDNMIIKYGDDIVPINYFAPKDDMEYMYSKGYTLAEVAPREVRGNALKYTHRLMLKSDITDSLKPDLLPYRAGGRRMYDDGTYFIKIGRGIELKGEMYNSHTEVLAAANSLSEAENIVSELNRAISYARQLRDGVIDDVAVQRMIDDNPFHLLNITQTNNISDLGKVLDIDYDAVAVRRGESMVYNNDRPTLMKDIANMEEDYSSLIQLKGTYYTKRGEILSNLFNESAKVMSLDDVMETSVNRFSTLLGRRQIEEKMGDIFKAKYSNYMDLEKVPNARNMTGVDLLRYGTLRELDSVPSADRKRLREAINFQNLFNRFVGAPSIGQKISVHFANSISDKMGVGAIRGKDAFSGLRSIIYNLSIGLGDVIQLPLQMSNIVATAVAHPVQSSKALYNLLPLYIGVKTKGINNLWYNAAKKYSTFTPKEWDNFMKYSERYGTTMGSYRLAVRNAPLAVDPAGIVNRMGKTGLRMLRAPFEVGTNINNFFHDVLAFIERGGENFRAIARRADDLTLNQTRATMSALEYGQDFPTKTLMQFSTYNNRFLEAMLFGKGLTPREKLANISTSIGLWGIVNNFATDEAAAQLEYNGDLLMKELGIPYQWRDIALNGLVGAYLHSVGMDYTGGGVGGQYANLPLADMMYQLYQTVMKDKDFEWASVLNIPSLRSIPTAAAGIYGVSTLAATAVDPDYDLVQWAKDNVSSPQPKALRNLTRWILAKELDQFYNRNGRLVTDGVKDRQWYLLYGFNPIESTQASKVYLQSLNMKTSVKALFDDIIKPYTEQFKFSAESNDDYVKSVMNGFNKDYQAVLKIVSDQYGIEGIRELQKLVQYGIMQRSIKDYNDRESILLGKRFFEYYMSAYGRDE